LFDVQLQGMSGIELARRLVATGGHAPIIFVTAHDNPETRAAAQAVGCTAYFLKNDAGADVLAAIRQAAG
jgi:DNA-binding NarL/FixJ family response regulator